MADKLEKMLKDAKNYEQKPEEKFGEGKITLSSQAGADENLNQRKGKVWGDNTSSSGENNQIGQHGRDGGTVDGLASNPAPSEKALEEGAEQTGEDTDMSKDTQNNKA